MRSFPVSLVPRLIGTLVRVARDGSAVAAIEFAVAAIPVLILLFGGITYGGVLAAHLAMRHAASEGARASIAGMSLCERQTRAETSARDALLFGALAASATIDVDTTEERVQVNLSFDYSSNPITPILFPVPESITAQAVAYTDGVEIPGSSC